MKMAVLIAAFAFGAALDFLMSIIGIAIILQAKGALAHAACIATAFALICLRLSVEGIYSRSGLLYVGLRWALYLAIVLEFFAITNAVAIHIIAKRAPGSDAAVNWSEIYHATTFPVLLFSVALIVFLVSSPIVVCYLWKNHGKEEGWFLGKATILRKPSSKREQETRGPELTIDR